MRRCETIEKPQATITGDRSNASTHDSEAPRLAHWNQAFRLAYFIWPDRSIALQILIKALALLDAECAQQDRRSEYRPLQRRTRTSKTRPQLLQHLVLCEVDAPDLFLPSTRSVELRRTFTEEDLIVRYLAHLVRISWRRSSFYVSLAIGRILHEYSTAETRAVTELVTQDPDRLRDDAIYRQGKRLLMNEVRRHFQPMLRVHRTARGEMRLLSRRPNPSERRLIHDTLRLLIPWGTSCALPVRFDPLLEELPGLRCSDDDPDAEHPVDMRRIHTLLHSACFGRATRSIGLDAPEDRLVVPCFERQEAARPGLGPQRAPYRDRCRDSRHAEPLDPEEQAMITAALDSLGRRQRQWSRARSPR
ncbi:MAG: hypothetical protein AAF560_20105 [Acidobacteriota bacterium]